MLTATIETRGHGSGVDENDKSLVRYEIVAVVMGNEVGEVVAFEREWLKYCMVGTSVAGTTWEKPDRRGLGCTIRSRNWVYAGIGEKHMRDALEKFGVEVS